MYIDVTCSIQTYYNTYGRYDVRAAELLSFPPIEANHGLVILPGGAGHKPPIQDFVYNVILSINCRA